MRIALTGNPNSGKTTLFNVLTGRTERVGNWAGVTVDKKESMIKKSYCGRDDITAVDLPGAYSMSPYTSEESVTSTYVRNEKPDAIINIVDTTNLSRSLFFTTQLLELGIPVVVALNKSDLTEKKGTIIDAHKLMKKLGCPVVETTSTNASDIGLKKVVEKAIAICGTEQKAPYVQGDVDMSSKEAVEQADRARYVFVNGVVKSVEKRVVFTSDLTIQDKIDGVFAHKLLGIPIFAVVMWAVFAISQTYVGPFIATYLCGGIDLFGEWVSGMTEGASPFLHALLVDGIIGGVGAVVGFLPLVMVMYFLIALLEDCGYMARAAVVMDGIFKRVGLSGKSIIPMVIGTGCAIPGVMACRTIKNERERRTTAMLAPFMPCGAKLPVIALFAGAFFSDASWVGTVMYFVGVLIILLGALLVLQITGHRYRKSFFIMELPEYKIPSLKRAIFSMFSRAKDFIIKAGTVILVCNAAVQIMQAFTPQLTESAMDSSDSILAIIAHPFSYVLIPIVGVASWRLAAAAVTGFIAKENVVGTLAVVFVGLTELIDGEELELIGSGSEAATVMGITKVAALAYLMFNLYTPPCFAAIGAMNAEIQDKKWFWGAIGLQFGTGFTVAFLVYQIGTVITEGTLGAGFIPGLIAIALMVTFLIYIIEKGKADRAKEYDLHAATAK